MVATYKHVSIGKLDFFNNSHIYIYVPNSVPEEAKYKTKLTCVQNPVTTQVLAAAENNLTFIATKLLKNISHKIALK